METRMQRIQYQGMTDAEFARLIAYDLSCRNGINPTKEASLINLLERVAYNAPPEISKKDPAQMELALN